MVEKGKHTKKYPVVMTNVWLSIGESREVDRVKFRQNSIKSTTTNLSSAVFEIETKVANKKIREKAAPSKLLIVL